MHEGDRTLGDVPGIDGLIPDAAVLPTDYSYPEVNAAGDITSDPTLLMDALDGVLGTGTGDPFSISVGALDPGATGASGGPLGGSGSTPRYDPMASSYMPTVDESGNVHGAVVAQGFDEEQVSNARIIEQVGKTLGASDRDIQIALMTGLVESGLRNLNYGDRDSLGVFQQRDAWGSAQDRTDVAKSAEMFFKGGQGGQRGLLDLADRDKMSMGEAAQAVQVSAYPDRYAQHQDEAAVLMGTIGASTDMGPITDASYVGPYRPNELLKRAQNLANAGGKDPYFNSVKDGSWYRDCQHMVANLSGRSSSGYATASAAWNHFESTGAAHPANGADGNEPPVGSWLYYSGSSSAGHVAVYLGNGKVASTDVFGNGRVGVGDMKELTDGAWHLNYLGWAAPWGEGSPQKIPNQQARARAALAGAPNWRDRVVRTAKTYLGTPFKWGGEDYTGVDTEGFIKGIYSKVGLDMPATGADLATLTEPISVEQAKPGDLIGWRDHPETGGFHYGVLIGNGRMIEAGVPGRVVQVNSIGHDALSGAFGIPIQKLINTPPKDPFKIPEVNHASVPSTAYNTYQSNYYTNPGTAEHVRNPDTGHSMVEPHASIPSHTHQHADPKGGQQAGLGALNPNHPHAPMPGEL